MTDRPFPQPLSSAKSFVESSCIKERFDSPELRFLHAVCLLQKRDLADMPRSEHNQRLQRQFSQ